MSRTVGGQFLLSEEARTVFSARFWRLARFCQLQPGTYTCLSNHFHVVVRVPPRVELSLLRLFKAVKRYYGPTHPRTLELAAALKEKDTLKVKQLRDSYHARMGNLSVFMKELKEGFSKWFNAQHDRFGTLWAERFRSVIICDNSHWFLGVNAYVDLNSVRAGVAALPEHYAFSGFSEAVARDGPAREALSKILPGDTWKEQVAFYRGVLYARGARATRDGQAILDPQVVYEVYKAGGKLSLMEALLLKIPVLTEGIAIGGEEFIHEVSQLICGHKQQPKPSHGGWPIEGAECDGLRSLKKVKKPLVLAKQQPEHVT